MTAAHMIAPAVKKQRCSSACTAWWRSAASQKYGMCQRKRFTVQSGSATSGCARTRSARTARTDRIGRSSGPVRPATMHSGARSPSIRCCTMWKAKDSSSPSVAIGETRATGTRDFGAFAGLYPLDERRLLAASTDGVGTKLMLARRVGRLRWAGADLAAHCINDVICTGAEPLFFLDYVAGERLELEQVAEL